MSGSGNADSVILGLIELCRLNGVPAHAERLTDGLTGRGRDLSQSDLAVALRRVNMSCRVAETTLGAIPRASLPVMLFMKSDGPVVLEQVNGERATIVQPETAGGRRELPLKELIEDYSGRALFSRPIDVLSDRLGEDVRERVGEISSLENHGVEVARQDGLPGRLALDLRPQVR